MQYLDTFCKFVEFVYFVSFLVTDNIAAAVLSVYFAHQFNLAGQVNHIYAAIVNTLYMSYTVYATVEIWMARGNFREGASAGDIAIVIIYLCVFVIIRIVYFARIFKSYINIELT